MLCRRDWRLCCASTIAGNVNRMVGGQRIESQPLGTLSRETARVFGARGSPALLAFGRYCDG